MIANNLAPWDLAAGIVLVREAGGRVSDLTGGTEMLSQGTVLASNDAFYPELLNLCKN